MERIRKGAGGGHEGRSIQLVTLAPPAGPVVAVVCFPVLASSRNLIFAPDSSREVSFGLLLATSSVSSASLSPSSPAASSATVYGIARANYPIPTTSLPAYFFEVEIESLGIPRTHNAEKGLNCPERMMLIARGRQIT